jgi:mannosyltransferase
MSLRERAALTLILLLAFALRIWAIDAQGIWGDEAFSIFTAGQPVSYVVSGGADLHPPLYHLLLHLWMVVAGLSPLALRFVSAWWSLLIVAAGYRICILSLSEDGTRRSALAILSAFLLAISPFQIYYAQETRMYAQAAALCALSLLFFIRRQTGSLELPALPRTREEAHPPSTQSGSSPQSGERRALGAWFVATLLAIYSHYFAFFILAAQDIYLLIVAWRARRAGLSSSQPAFGELRSAIKAQALMALLYLPWVVVQASYLSSRANSRASTLSWQSIGDVPSQSLGALFIGTTVDGVTQVGCALVCLGLAMLGLIVGRKAPFAGLLLLCIAVPIAGAIAVNPLLPYFRERFLLISSPAFIILMAYGIVHLASIPSQRFAQPVYLFSIVSIVLISALVLGNYRFDPRYHKGEYDQAIAAIRADARPDDAVLIYSPIQDALYDYYRIDGLSAYALPGANLEAVRAKHPRAWLLLYGDPAVYDPAHAAEAYLSAYGFKSFYQSYRDGALARYDFAPGYRILGGGRITFGDAFVLTGFALPAGAARGSTLPLTFQWQASRVLSANYTVFVHLLSADGKVAAQMDTQPAGGTRPTKTWLLGETVRDNIGVALPATTPAGRYRVEMGMYDLLTLRRLPVGDAGGLPVQDDAVVIGEVEIR